MTTYKALALTDAGDGITDITYAGTLIATMEEAGGKHGSVLAIGYGSGFGKTAYFDTKDHALDWIDTNCGDLADSETRDSVDTFGVPGATPF